MRALTGGGCLLAFLGDLCLRGALLLVLELVAFVLLVLELHGRGGAQAGQAKGAEGLNNAPPQLHRYPQAGPSCCAIAAPS